MHGITALERALARMLEEATSRVGANRLAEASRSYLKAAQYADELIELTQAEDGAAAEAWRLRAIEYRSRAQALIKGRFDNRRCRPHVMADADDKTHLDGEADALEQQILLLIDDAPRTTTWESIGGMEGLKRELKFHYGMALAQPPAGMQLEGWRNLMFYGPPGTGKTLMACAIAHKLTATFFNIKAHQLVSKWVGESGKLVATLYRMARHYARDGLPSIIFIDEFDAICKNRESAGHLHHQQMLASILAEIDGYGSKPHELVLTIGATNRPDDLDPAVLSRFERHIHFMLPDLPARADIFRIHLSERGIPLTHDFDLKALAAASQGLSGRDIQHVCKQSIARVVQEMNPQLLDLVDQGLEAVRSYTIRMRPLQMIDIQAALADALVKHGRHTS
jgi:SpoVK/Ycf46/Vps4 family AAA+-type ATPase